jgi:ABC-type phosphate/phosphonate transport system substrate-binding protein
MKRWTFSGAGAAVALLGLLSACQRAPSGEDALPSTVRVGLSDSLFHGTPEPVAQIALRPLKSILEAQTGAAGQIVAGGDVDGLARRLKDDRVQLAVFAGVEFAWARRKQPALKPLLIAVNQRRDARAELVVRKDARCAGPEDLKGRAVALPRFSHQHCRLFLQRRCVPADDAPEEFFSRVTAPVTDEDALDGVVDGDLQAAVVDAVFLEAYRKDKPGRAAQLKTLAESESFPGAILVVAYNPDVLSERQLARVRDGLIDARSTDAGRQFLKVCRVTGFEAPPDDFEQTLVEAAQAYPPDK